MFVLICSIFILQIDVINSFDGQPYTLFSQSFTSSSFGSSDGWAVYNGPSEVSDCGPYRILGGLGKFAGTTIEKIFNVPPIYELKITVTLLIIDSWDGEYFKIYANGQEKYQLLGGQTEGPKLCGAFTCGSSECVTKVETIEVIIHYPYQGNVKITMRAFLDEDAMNESWGIRDFKLWGRKCPTDCGLCENYIF